MLVAGSAVLAADPAAAVSQPGWSAEELNILIIGDSNTEMGHIASGLNTLLKEQFGDSGSGYVPMHDGKLGVLLPKTIAVRNDDGWKKFDMFDGHRLPPPYLAPDGNWVTSVRAGVTTTVTFTGAAIDIYWLGQPEGGAIQVVLDGEPGKPISTAAPTLAVHKTNIPSPKAGDHVLTLTAGDGKVTLVGADALAGAGNRRAVVHKWGNGFATTKDFLAIEEGILRTGLEELNPQVLVLLLGTNDHNIDKSSPEAFESQLVQLLERIKKAVPKATIVLTSTFATNTDAARTLLPKYLTTAYPNAAQKAGVFYWDMSTWFGAFNRQRMVDNYHCNAEGGKLIATEMFAQITKACEAQIRRRRQPRADEPFKGHQGGREGSTARRVNAQGSWKYGTGRSSCWRAASQSSVSLPWHLGQARLRQE